MKYEQLAVIAAELITEASKKYHIPKRRIHGLKDRYTKDKLTRAVRGEIMQTLNDMGYTLRDIGLAFNRDSTTVRDYITLANKFALPKTH